MRSAFRFRHEVLSSIEVLKNRWSKEAGNVWSVERDRAKELRQRETEEERKEKEIERRIQRVFNRDWERKGEGEIEEKHSDNEGKTFLLK